MPVTVAVPTAGRPERLRRLLAALPEATAGADVAEVLVVDNDPAGSARAAVRASGLDARCVLEPERGSAHARNRAVAEARTDVVAFLDDDVVPQPGWLAQLLVPLRAGAAAAGGRVVLEPAVPRPRWLDEDGIGGYLTAFDLGGPARALHPDEYVVTASAAFALDPLRSIGGFDPALGPRGRTQLVADDVHVVRSLMGAGHEVWWQPAAVVVHDLPLERLRRQWLLRRAYLQGRSEWLLDAEVLRRRRAGGARVALAWLAGELRRRRAEGLSRQEIRFHLATDVARTMGALDQALRWRGAERQTRRRPGQR